MLLANELSFRTALPNRRQRVLTKLVPIAGGLLIMAGIILLGVAALAAIGFVNIGVMLENKYLLTFALLMVMAGLVDVFSAIIIARW
jgi:hypothetical protein